MTDEQAERLARAIDKLARSVLQHAFMVYMGLVLVAACSGAQ